MKYKFEKVKENYPKRANRSKRSLKKLHLKEYAETIVSINISYKLLDSPYERKLLNSMYEFDSGMFVTNSEVIFYIPTVDFTFKYVQKYCEKLFMILSEIDQSLAEIGIITVRYGDAYYGEW